MRFARLSVVLGVAAAMGAAACSFGGESTDASNDEITAGGDVSQVLKSVLVLETGCMDVKSGPKQLILAARCVVGNAAIAEGKSVGFTLASGITGPCLGAEGCRDGRRDEERWRPPRRSARSRSHRWTSNPSFLSNCADNTCGFDALAASDAKDIAVLTLTDELDTITTIPVDLELRRHPGLAHHRRAPLRDEHWRAALPWDPGGGRRHHLELHHVFDDDPGAGHGPPHARRHLVEGRPVAPGSRHRDDP